MSYIITYAFMLPASESGQLTTLRVLDEKLWAPFTTAIAAYKLTLPTESTSGLSFSIYPFHLNISSVLMEITAGSIPGTTDLNWKTNINLTRVPNVMASTNSSKLLFEVLDADSRKLGSQSVSLYGDQKLVNGEQYITISNVNINGSKLFPLTINVYETYDTPSGSVKHLIGNHVQSY